jgi:hypothetical protein
VCLFAVQSQTFAKSMLHPLLAYHHCFVKTRANGFVVVGARRRKRVSLSLSLALSLSIMTRTSAVNQFASGSF